MLHEIVGLADEPPARRRWFHDDYFDLFVWQAVTGEVIHFQLCYGTHSSEQALVWHREGSFFHDGDSGDEAPGEIFERFDTAAPTLPKAIRLMVGARLREFAAREGEIPNRRHTFRRATWQKRLPPADRKAG
jgi:hypothetical protein